MAAHDIEHLGQDGIAKRIEYMIAVFPIQHQLAAAKDRKVLRKIRLLDAEPLLNGSGGEFSDTKNLDDRDAGRMRERLKDARLVRPQGVLHIFRIFELSNIRKSLLLPLGVAVLNRARQ